MLGGAAGQGDRDGLGAGEGPPKAGSRGEAKQNPFLEAV